MYKEESKSIKILEIWNGVTNKKSFEYLVTRFDTKNKVKAAVKTY